MKTLLRLFRQRTVRLGYQLQEQLPLDITFGLSEPSIEDDQVFVAYKFVHFHSFLLSRGRSFSVMAALHSYVRTSNPEGPGVIFA
jgi:hypothetical protein